MTTCHVEEARDGLYHIINDEGESFWVDALSFETQFRGLQGELFGFKALTPDAWHFTISKVGWNTLKAMYEEMM